MMRIMGIDPGERRTGIAISDPTKTIANPVIVYEQSSRKALAQKIIALVGEKEIDKIIIGQALDSDGNIGFQARRAIRLAEEINKYLDIPIVMWDESFTTQKAKHAQTLLKTKKKKKKMTLDAIAATLILQSYLDINYSNPEA